MSLDTLRLTAKQANDLDRQERCPRMSSSPRLPRRDRRPRRRAELFPARLRRRARRRDPDRAQGRHQHEGHPDHGRLEDPRELRARCSTPTVAERARRAASVRSARRTWTSSRWARRPKTRRTARRGNPWDPERVPGGSSGGSAGCCAAGLAPGRSAPTPAARSSSRPPSAGSSGYAPPTGRCPATASSPSRPASTRLARSRRRSRTARSSTR